MRELARSNEFTPVGKICRLNDQILALRNQLDRQDFWKPPMASDRKLFDVRAYLPPPWWEQKTDKGYTKRKNKTKVFVRANLRTKPISRSEHNADDSTSLLASSKSNQRYPAKRKILQDTQAAAPN